MIDINPYARVMGKMEKKKKSSLLGVIKTVRENRAPGSNGLVSGFQRAEESGQENRGTATTRCD